MRAFIRFSLSNSHSTSSPSKRLLFDAEVYCAEPLYSRGIIGIRVQKMIRAGERRGSFTLSEHREAWAFSKSYIKEGCPGKLTS